MRHASRLWCLLLFPLLFHPPGSAGPHDVPASGPDVYTFALGHSQYDNFTVDAYANTTVVYSLQSSTSVSVAFMTLDQYLAFSTISNDQISNSIICTNGTEVNETLHEGPGQYDVLVYAYGSRAHVKLSLTVFPNNPLVYGPFTSPEPSGIASFGLVNKSGIDTPYSVSSTDVVGVAAISSMQAYNATAPSAGVNPSGLTLQLNSVLAVYEKGGGSQVYWCQDTPDFVTSASTVAMSDNVWNFSASGFLSNSTITSEGDKGTVYTYVQYGQTQYYYSYEGSNSTYALPLTFALLINATTEPGVGVLLQFGARPSGTTSFGDVWFDNVTIRDPKVTGAAFLTDGNDTTPDGLYYDTELVFAGEGNGESTSFTSMSSSLGLFYANGTSHALTPFPSYFSFGQDTDEAADNLRMTYLGSGEVTVSTGAPNYEYLGTASGSATLASAEDALDASLGLTTTTSTTSTSTSGTTTNSTSTTSTSASAATTSSTSGVFTTPSTVGVSDNGVPEFPYSVVLAPLSAVLVVSAYLVARRKGR